jgi:hypothetical protein
MTVFGKTVDTTRKFTVRKGKKELGVYDSYERAVEVLKKNTGATLTYFVK